MYPNVDVKKKKYPLQSILFGHRIQPSQTKYEYLIEFLQVAISKKANEKDEPPFESHVTGLTMEEETTLI